ncbi:MAG: GTP pyrophosphokinase [Clostridium sp.]|nr:GTP pyrophosphokinase [Clostridium sp.]
MCKITKEEYLKIEEIALRLISEYHKDMVDKGGNPYINHLKSVSNNCLSYESKIIALLHDIIEDTSCTKDILLKNDIPEFVVEGVLIVTRQNNETYNEFIERIINSNNKYAIEVKYNDLKDNCRLERLNNSLSESIDKAKKMIEKRYMPALIKVESELKKINKN